MAVQGALTSDDGTEIRTVLYATQADGTITPVLCDSDGKIITTT